MNKVEAREQSEKAMAEFLARGGQVEVLKGRKNPKQTTANGKNMKGALRMKFDPTTRTMLGA